MKSTFLYALGLATVLLISCNQKSTTTENEAVTYDTTFVVEAEAFADLQLLRYEVPGFNQLTLQQKQLAYYLYEAALSGRDIIYDQKSKYGLLVRKTIEAVYENYKGDKNDTSWKQFETYCGRVWFSNGNYHHYSNEKFIPACSFDYFKNLVSTTPSNALPLNEGENLEAFAKRIQPIIFDASFMPKCVDLRAGVDNIANSANNYYEGVTQKEVEAFYNLKDTKGNAPSWGLNSKVVKENAQLLERTWKVGGMYDKAITQIVYWLEKAASVAENDQQKKSLNLLVDFYKTGNLKTFDDYSIEWVHDTASRIDVVNGFIEVYLDAIGKKGSFQSMVSMKDMEATKRIAAIAAKAQWFEDHSPLMPEHKKKQVKGITAKAITTIVESGDNAPSTPIGVNLPNADWIRKEYGSKSVSLSNIIHSYNVNSSKSGMLDEFVVDATVKNRLKKYGALASDLHTDMHECIGHASGQINKGVETPDKTLKNYASCLEEARADLVGLYYIMDKKLIEIGVAESEEVGKAGYDQYMMNGLMTQLTRLKPGEKLEEAHMRNRQLNARWVFEKGKQDNVVELIKVNNKTYVRINDYNKLRNLFGQLLREIQRIKSEGDYKAATALVETYGVNVDPVLHKEIISRYATLGIKPYRGFIQPVLEPVLKGDNIIDVKVTYPASFFQQMMDYKKKYSFLPTMN